MCPRLAKCSRIRGARTEVQTLALCWHPGWLLFRFLYNCWRVKITSVGSKFQRQCGNVLRNFPAISHLHATKSLLHLITQPRTTLAALGIVEACFHQPPLLCRWDAASSVLHPSTPNRVGLHEPHASAGDFHLVHTHYTTVARDKHRAT